MFGTLQHGDLALGLAVESGVVLFSSAAFFPFVFAKVSLFSALFLGSLIWARARGHGRSPRRWRGGDVAFFGDTVILHEGSWV